MTDYTDFENDLIELLNKHKLTLRGKLNVGKTNERFITNVIDVVPTTEVMIGNHRAIDHCGPFLVASSEWENVVEDFPSVDKKSDLNVSTNISHGSLSNKKIPEVFKDKIREMDRNLGGKYSGVKLDTY